MCLDLPNYIRKRKIKSASFDLVDTVALSPAKVTWSYILPNFYFIKISTYYIKN